MKAFFTFLFTLLFGISQSQSIDTVQVKQELDSLINLNVRFVSEMDLDSAFMVLKKAEVRCLETLGDRNLHYATIINKQGLIYYYWQDYYAIEPLWVETLKIRETVLGKLDPEYAKSVNNLGLLYRILGDLELSEKYYMEALSIRSKTLGKDHKDYGKTLNGLALLKTDLGKYDEAESLYFESIKIRSRQFGVDHPEYANSLLNLGNVYIKTARYDKALEMYSKMLSIYEKTKGKNCSAYVIGLTNSGDVYTNIGELKKAESCYLEAMKIEANIYGTNSIYYASSLNNLGSLYVELGQYSKAERYFLESLEIEKDTYGEHHKSYADVLNSLGNLYKTLERYEDAEFNFLKTKDIYAIELGKDHSNYAGILNNLGLLYLSMKDYIKAEVHFQESIEIRKRTIGVSHPDYAESLANFGFLYWRKGDHRLAEKCYQDAKVIFEKVYGRQSTDYLKLIEDIANYYFDIGNIESSVMYSLEADTLRKEFLINATSYLSERELEKLVNTFKRQQNLYLSLAMVDPDLSDHVYDNCLFYKGYLLNTVRQKNRLANADSISGKLILELKKFRRTLASLYSQAILERDSISIEKIEEKANSVEKELVRSIDGFQEASKQVYWQDVQASLSDDEVAIEFVDFNLHTPYEGDSVQYVATLIRPGDDQPIYIPLFKESCLDALFGSFIDRKSDYVNRLYSINDRGAVPLEKAGKTLYEIIWKPLEKYLLNTNTIYFAPSGELNRINLNAIPLDEINTLGDRYKMVQLSSTRTKALVEDKETSTNNAVIYGGLDYNNVFYKSVTSGDKMEEQKFDLKKRGTKWNELKWTKTEAEAIYSILVRNDKQVDLMTGIDGSEESFKSIGHYSPSPQIIHLATHGFFFSDQKQKTQNDDRNPVFEFNKDPMLRSGILLAGANQTWEEGIANSKTEDGILTAYEISQMDLSNTELVVLSACETGLGDIVGNEGVYGLQRAFKIAGVKYLIMSLWQIPDRQTKDFMTTFYRHYINAGQSISTAFRNTQKEMKDRFYDPYLWAGFVLVE